MALHQYVFWLVSISGAVLAGWWLAVRPGASMRDVATPVSALAIVLALLMAMLSFSGQGLGSFASEVFAMARGY